MKIQLIRLLCVVSGVAACAAPATPADSSTDTGVAADVGVLDSGLDDSSSVVDSGVALDSAVLPVDSGASDSGIAVDVSNPFADAGPLGEPAWVPITVLTSGTCPALNPCGGAIAGTWDVSGACIEVPIASAVAMCPGAMITRSDGRARGRVVFGSSPMVARRVAQFEAQVDVFVPALCATVAGGCSVIERGFVAVNPMSSCVPTPSGDCRCTSRSGSSIDDTDGYRTEGNEIVSSTLGKRWAYCAADGSLRYRDSSPSGPREPGTVTLRRR